MTPEKTQRSRSSAYALVFAAALPQLKLVARRHGYALGVHGSMSTDLDLIAVPWVVDASDAATLVEALRETINGHWGEWDYSPMEKPHGRTAWTLYCKGQDVDTLAPYLDISVMPRSQDTLSASGEEA